MKNGKKPIEKHACRACGGPIITVFDMGSFFPNEFPREGAGPSRERIPLRWMRCHPCGLIQLSHTTPPEWLFGVHADYPYWYRSSVNESMRMALADVTGSAAEFRPLRPGDTIIDIGANDGTLLKNFDGCGLRRIAFEPALNLHEDLSRHAEVVVRDFFPAPERITGLFVARHQAAFIFSVAMLYDLDDPGSFVAEIKRLLAPDGVWVAQFAYLPAILRNAAYDGTCHEHLLYLALLPLLRLLGENGLQAIDAYEVPVNEGSLRVFITHKDSKVRVDLRAFNRVRQLVEQEKVAGLTATNEPYLSFVKAVEDNRHQVRKLLLQSVINGWTVDLLGASTKGNTWLQWNAIDHRHVRRAIERSPEKIGRETITGIPIVGEDLGRRSPAQLLLCPIWSFRDAVIDREKGKWPFGTKLAFCLPKVEVVNL